MPRKLSPRDPGESSTLVYTHGVAKKPHERSAPHIRVVTFNVHFAEEPKRIVEAIKANDILKSADVLFLQEIESHDHEKISRVQIIAEELDMHYVYGPARKVKTGGTHGLAILSKFPLLDVEIIPLSFYKLFWSSRDRIALEARIKVGSEPLKVVNVHLDTLINAKDRLKQLEPVILKALANPKEKMVIAGDFNTIPIHWFKRIFPIFYSDQRKIVDSFFSKHGFKTQIDEMGYTLKRGYVRLRLDSIYVRGIELINFGIERAVRASDHLPLWADIVI